MALNAAPISVRTAAQVRTVVIQNARADRCAVVDRCAEADRFAELQSVEEVPNERVRSVLVPNGVRVVAQTEEGDRSVEADLPVEVDRGVLARSGVRVATQNAEVQVEARNGEVRSVLVRSEVQSALVLIGVQSALVLIGARSVLVRSAARSDWALIGFRSVARVGFDFLPPQSHASDYSRFLAALELVFHRPAWTDAPFALAVHHVRVRVGQQHPMALERHPAHSCSTELHFARTMALSFAQEQFVQEQSAQD
jgi:hypothetical protein